MIFGAGIGAGIGAAIHNVAMQSGLGAGLGLIIWAIFFSKNNRNDVDIKEDKNGRNDYLPPQ